ncbi:winged helix-turn-helix domain-containing protein [Patescibacteria group bacterium]|nr:winged helix-turn-helix domain-containing protein [Patescibacteria group bacterium]MBU1966836.1 winged helix-turn-helix domain-containing protein [Patescibacteria group bacterium]MBU2543358.1 winged helix-turn-helix domain-containing protein [Patescibacteria group bacterium]
MKTNTDQKIIEIIQQDGQVRPNDLVKKLNISQVAVHKQLNKLLNQRKIVRQGNPPLVFYSLFDKKKDVSFDLNLAATELDVNQDA